MTSEMAVHVHFFDARAACEPIRMILSYGGVKFEDHRYPFPKLPATLPTEIKSKSRWGQVPFVEWEGKNLSQSLAIARYFAKKFDLIPNDLYEAALCDEFVDTVLDLKKSFYPLYCIEDPKEFEEKAKPVIETGKSKYLDIFESIIKANGGVNLVGKSLTWADIYLACILDNSQIMLKTDLTTGYPHLKNLQLAVFSIPAIKDWVEKRPKTKF